ncbi:hypothetical protein CKO36_16715 [Rhabdochromatium marinum]|nr:hypothetical protein [Rhabdochromatium marinum]
MAFSCKGRGVCPSCNTRRMAETAAHLVDHVLPWRGPQGANRRGGLHTLVRLLRYCARPPFAADRLEEIDAQRLIYHLPKPGPNGQTQIILSPLELIGRIAALVPPPRQHRHRDYGNRRRRGQRTTRRQRSDVPPPAISGLCSWPASTRLSL